MLTSTRNDGRLSYDEPPESMPGSTLSNNCWLRTMTKTDPVNTNSVAMMSIAVYTFEAGFVRTI
jgi:hypothetical protein